MKRPCQSDFDTRGDDYFQHGKFHMAIKKQNINI
jgi:hypothetical protein